MPNIGRPREAKRRLVASVVYSKMLHAAPVWEVPLATMLSKKAVFGTERSGAENSLSVQNCANECCVCPGEYAAKRHLSDPQEAHLCEKPIGDRSYKGSYP